MLMVGDTAQYKVLSGDSICRSTAKGKLLSAVTEGVTAQCTFSA